MFRLILVLTLFQAVFTQCSRPSDKYIGDLCYSISNLKLKFTDAQSACYQNNENLAVIHNTLQANFLASSVRSQTGAEKGKFWIGLSRPALNSRFQWDDGTTMAWSNFDSNFPKDNLYVAESTVNGKWQTLDGEQPLYFVCSYNPGNVTPGWGSTWMPVSGPTGLPVSGPTSFPVSGSTGFPASGPTGFPASSNIPVSDFSASNTPGYPTYMTTT